MDKIEKLHMMEKLLRELDDVVNSQTSLLKKVAQIEAENINLGNRLLEKQLPEIHSKADEALTIATALQNEFTEVKDKFVKDNKLDEVLPEP
jgi:regulator of replication initiation timing